MKLWSTMRRETSGAWRSLRYDIDRVRRIRAAVALSVAETTEMSRPTLPAGRSGSSSAAQRPPRRVAAATGVALLVAGGAAGTYLAVAGSLAALTADPSGVPVAAPEPTSVTTTQQPPSPLVTPKRAAQRQAGRRPVNAPAAVATPPAVPTPSVGTGTPEGTVTASPSASASPSPSASPSASTSASPSPYRSRRPAGDSGVGR